MENFLPFLLCYFTAVSIVSVIVCVFDKHRARVHKRRVSEAALLRISALGGAAAMYVTMRLIRHKTLHKKFMVGLPLIILAQIILVVLIFLLDKGML